MNALTRISVAALLACVAAAAVAQNYPAKPVRIVVPFPPSGAADLLTRTLGTEVNLANIEWDEIYLTEIVRRGMAGDASHPLGAYRLAGFGAGEQ